MFDTKIETALSVPTVTECELISNNAAIGRVLSDVISANTLPGRDGVEKLRQTLGRRVCSIKRRSHSAESNAIGDFYTCATLLEEPVRSKLQDIIRRYAQLKVDAVKSIKLGVAGEAQEKILQQFVRMHGQMTRLVAQAIAQKTLVAIPLTNTLNNLTSNHAARLHAYRDRLPWSVVVLLFLGSAVCMVLIGQQQGKAGKAHLIGTLTFIFLVTLVVYVTLDLNQPGSGLITVSQEPFERLLQSMTN